MTVRARAALAAAVFLAGACGGGDIAPAVPIVVEHAGAGESAAAGGDAPASSGSGGAPGGGEGTEPGAPGSGRVEEGLTAPLDTVPPTGDAAGDEAVAGLEPVFGGTLRVAVEAETDGLNPTANNFAVSAYVMAFPMFDPLAYWDTSGQWIPYLAESFTEVGDGSAWRMKLREGVRFHDGTDLDADDVIATFEAQLADPLVSLAIIHLYERGEPIVKIDDLTVEYRLTQPFAAFPRQLTNQLGMVLPSEWLDLAYEDPTLNQMPVGQGPFMIESRVQDTRTVLVRNPDYWAADAVDVYLDRIEVYPITDPAIAASRLVAGELDMMITDNPDAISALRDAGEVRTVENLRSGEHFAMLNTSKPPFDDVRARQALTFLTDRDAYVALIRQDTAVRADTMFHPDLIWHNPNVVQETNMAEQAAPLVEAYCADNPDHCSDGRINMELQHSGPSVIQTRIADLLVDSWADHFNVTVQELLQDNHIVEVALGQYDAVTWRQFGEVDPDNDVVWLQCASVSFISLNWTRYCDTDRDALMYEQRGIADLDRRVEIWHQIQRMVRDAYTHIFFNHANWTIGARDTVHNVCGQTAPADGTELFCNNQGRAQLHQVWLG